MNYAVKCNDKNYKVVVDYDHFVDNPRIDGFYESTMFLKSNNMFYCDDEHINRFEDISKKFFGREKEFSIRELREQAHKKGYAMLPIWGLNHSGIVLGTTEHNPFGSWDSGLLGFIWEKTDNIQETELLLENEVDTMERYMDGRVYTVSIESFYRDDNYQETIGNVYLDCQNPDSVKEFVGEMLGSDKLCIVDLPSNILTEWELEDIFKSREIKLNQENRINEIVDKLFEKDFASKIELALSSYLIDEGIDSLSAPIVIDLMKEQEWYPDFLEDACNLLKNDELLDFAIANYGEELRGAVEVYSGSIER